MDQVKEKSFAGIDFQAKALRVLDVGCGQGSELLTLAIRRAKATNTSSITSRLSTASLARESISEFVGIDMDKGAIQTGERLVESARKIGKLSADVTVTLCHGDAQKLPFAAESFDHVRCQFTLLHSKHAKTIVQEMLRVVKRNGGQLVIIEGDTRSHISYSNEPIIVEMESTLDKLAAKFTPSPTVGAEVSIWLREMDTKSLFGRAENLTITVDAIALFTPKPSSGDPGLGRLRNTLLLGVKSGYFSHESMDAYLKLLQKEEDRGAVMRTSIVFTTTCLRN